MTFGDPSQMVEELFSDWEVDNEVLNPKVDHFVVRVAASGVDFADLSFFNDQLYSVITYYGEDRLAAMGSAVAIVERLVAMFGPFTSENLTDVDADLPFEVEWVFESCSRMIQLSVQPDSAQVMFCDTNLGTACLNALRRQADLGF